jgi:hypothetical protein
MQNYKHKSTYRIENISYKMLSVERSYGIVIKKESQLFERYFCIPYWEVIQKFTGEKHHAIIGIDTKAETELVTHMC